MLLRARSQDRQLWLLIVVAGVTGCVCSEKNESLTLLPSSIEMAKQVGETYVVRCQSNQSIDSDLKWLSPNGSSIEMKTGRIHVESLKINKSLSLIFSNIHPKDRGNYTCSSIVNGTEKQTSFELFVIEPIQFKDTKEVQYAKEFSNETLRCEATGDPQPTLNWNFNNNPIYNNDKYIMLENGLQLTNVTLEDGGLYTCRAEQLASTTANMKEKYIMLTIQHKPRWYSDKGSQTFGYLTAVVNLTCQVEAVPAAEFQWLKNKNVVKENDNITIFKSDNRSVLQLSLESIDMFGDYICKATNSEGILERVLTLTESTRADPPSLTDDIEATPSSLQLHISEPNYTGQVLPILGFRVQYKESKKKTWENAPHFDFDKSFKADSYTLNNLQHSTQYDVRVATRNQAGFSVYSSPMTARTEMAVEVAVPENPASGTIPLGSSAPIILAFVWSLCHL